MSLRSHILLTTALAGVFVAGAASAQTTSGGTTVDEVVVTGIRESLKKSIQLKRETNAIVEVITAEAVGKFPDTNVAESLSRLPGVTVDHQFGQGEQVSIAGTEPSLNRIYVDGHAIASADWGGNPSDRSSRTFNYSLLSPDIIGRAELYKTPEARLDEGSLGATVIIRTRKPLDLDPNTLSLSGGYSYNDRSEKGNGKLSGLYSWRNEAGTLGILGAVTYDRENLSRAGVAVYGYGSGGDFLNKDANGNILGMQSANATINGAAPTTASMAALNAARYPAFLAHEYFQQVRKRVGLSGAIQWKPVDSVELTLTGLSIRGQYNNLSQSEYSYNVRGDRLQNATVADGLVTAASYGSGTGGSWNGELDTNYRKTQVKNDSINLAGKWTGDLWTVSGNTGYTKASGGKNPEYLLSFRTLQGFSYGFDGKNTVLNWANPGTDATQLVGTSPAENSVRDDPRVLAVNGGQPFNGAQIGGITYAEKTIDKEKYGQVDFTRDLDLGPFTKLLFGAKYSDHDNSQTTMGGATFTNRAFSLADLGSISTPDGLFDGLNTTGNGVPFATLSKETVIKTLASVPGQTINVNWGLDTGSFFQVNEKNTAAYVQGDFKGEKYRGNIGGRLVKTEDTSTFYLTVTDANTLATTTNLTTVKNSNTKFLPAFNFAYDAGDTVVLRAAAAKVIARARYSDLAGAFSRDDIRQTAGGGNPDLKPYEATNFGLSAEWYFAPGGLLSGEVFYRDITNYVGNESSKQDLADSTGQVRSYDVSTPVNGGKAKVTGFSLSYQADLGYGFGVQSNYTFTSSETDNGLGIPFLSRDTVNLVPYYEHGPWQARLSYNYRSKYFNRFGRLQSADYSDAYTQLDFQGAYKFTDRMTLTLNASNLLDETYFQYSSVKSAPTALYKNGRVVSLNFSYKM
ncbi:MAG: TonB-dependent receptor [Caulobacter sp.]|nr:TonB-dependent receptor [Caulobacter sp.]